LRLIKGAYPARSSAWHDALFRLQQSGAIDMMPVLTSAEQHWQRQGNAKDGLSTTKITAHAGGGKQASSTANMVMNTVLDTCIQFQVPPSFNTHSFNTHGDRCPPSN